MNTTDIISDARARTISAWWHEWITTPCPLYALQSTGYIGEHTEDHVERLLANVEAALQPGAETHGWDERDADDLRSVLAYVRHHGQRGPQDGWHDLWDNAYENARH